MFLSSATNTLDAKGRISVPAGFRANVGDGNFDGVVVWPSFNGAYLEGGGMALLQDYQSLLESMDPYDDVRISFERAIFGESRPLSFDSTGRITLPKDFAQHAGLSQSATFVGMGRRFEIWSPENYNSCASAARATSRENKQELRLMGRSIVSPGASS